MYLLNDLHSHGMVPTAYVSPPDCTYLQIGRRDFRPKICTTDRGIDHCPSALGIENGIENGSHLPDSFRASFF